MESSPSRCSACSVSSSALSTPTSTSRASTRALAAPLPSPAAQAARVCRRPTTKVLRQASPLTYFSSRDPDQAVRCGSQIGNEIQSEKKSGRHEEIRLYRYRRTKTSFILDGPSMPSGSGASIIPFTAEVGYRSSKKRNHIIFDSLTAKINSAASKVRNCYGQLFACCGVNRIHCTTYVHTRDVDDDDALLI